MFNNFKKKERKEVKYINSSVIVGGTLFIIFLFIFLPYVENTFINNYNNYIQLKNYTIGFIVGIFITIITHIISNSFKKEIECQSKIDSVNDKINLLSDIINENIILSVTDNNGLILEVTDSFLETYGFNKDEVIGQNHSLIKSNKVPNEIYIEMWYSISNGEVWEGEFLNRSKNGDEIWIKSTIIPELKDGDIVRYRSISHNITTQKKANFILEYDTLTKLPNKFNFEKSVEHAIKISNRLKSKLAILFIDLDNFKSINDNFGYKGGDYVIQIISNRLKTTIRDGDIISRYSGDEFVILLEDIDYDLVLDISNNLIQSIKEEIIINNQKASVTASVGISFYPKNGNSMSELIKNADSAMFHAKNSNKDKIVFFNDEISSEYKRKLDIENSIKSSLVNDGFKVVYQPKYNLNNKKILGAEALIRMKDNKYSPDEFIKVAELTNKIGDISKFVIKRVFEDLVKMKSFNIDITNYSISLNLSSQDLKDESLLDYILDNSKIYSIPCHIIGIEVTEYTLMKDIDKTINILNKFQDNNIKVYIDDFGTGYSSMAYLKLLPINIIKIDKSFTNNIAKDKRDLHITTAIINLSKILGFEIVVEGIEEIEQEEILKSLGCSQAQGYLFSKPIELNDFINKII